MLPNNSIIPPIHKLYCNLKMIDKLIDLLHSTYNPPPIVVYLYLFLGIIYYKVLRLYSSGGFSYKISYGMIIGSNAKE